MPGHRGKLTPCFAGPFQVVERVGTVTYHLRLPEGACIHDVFHVTLLKWFEGDPPAAIMLLPPILRAVWCQHHPTWFELD